jgi:two-component system OmpR family response regulator
VRILVVEDDAKLRLLLGRGLAEEGYAVDVAGTGADAIWRVAEYPYDAVVLDVGLPDTDGFSVCQTIRERGHWVPVLMLTALGEVDHRVRGLDVGADDYLVKPFAFAELIARLRALLRRGAEPRPTTMRVGDLALDPASHTVMRGGTRVELTAREFSLLEYLMRYRGEVISRTRLVDHVWVAYLRDKIDRPFGRATIETVRGAGYRLRIEETGATTD